MKDVWNVVAAATPVPPMSLTGVIPEGDSGYSISLGKLNSPLREPICLKKFLPQVLLNK